MILDYAVVDWSAEALLLNLRPAMYYVRTQLLIWASKLRKARRIRRRTQQPQHMPSLTEARITSWYSLETNPAGNDGKKSYPDTRR
jgi:hypothetical protein